MKKLTAILLCIVLLLSVTGCGSETPPVTEPVQTTAPTETTAPEKDLAAELDAILEQMQYEGIVYLTKGGELVYSSVSGTNDLGDPLTIDAPMYLCSVSKQFCAAAVLILKDRGLLRLEDTLAQYFPEYTIGKDITIKQLLSMRSGIVRDVAPMVTEPENYLGSSREENLADFKEWLFSQPLEFSPGTGFSYSNAGYTLLSVLVEQVSGQGYEDFVRQNIFTPLGMEQSGFVSEVETEATWNHGLTHDSVDTASQLPYAVQGCGDITSTAADMDLWMTGLRSGAIVSTESYEAMTTSYVSGYGYGLMEGPWGCWGHDGALPSYTSCMFFNEAQDLNLLVITGNTPMFKVELTNMTAQAILQALFEG